MNEYVWHWAEAHSRTGKMFLRLLTFVVVTTYLIHRGSHESKDTDDQVQQALDRIERRLEQVADSTSSTATNGQAPARRDMVSPLDSAGRPHAS
jgi:hypothetical protein